jgi:hypothetical protein
MTQGDIFAGVPWPSLPEAISYRDVESGEELYMPGTWSFKHAMLITAHQALWPPKGPGVYAVMLVPLEPIAALTALGGQLDQSDVDEADAYDDLLNYMYVSGDSSREIEDSMAQLFQPFCVHRDVINDQCVARLTYPVRQQLQRKLCMLMSYRSWPRGLFTPP